MLVLATLIGCGSQPVTYEDPWGLVLTSFGDDVGSARYDGELHFLSDANGPILVDDTRRHAVMLDSDGRSLLRVHDAEEEVARLPRLGDYVLPHKISNGELFFSDDDGLYVAPQSDDWTPDPVDSDFFSIVQVDREHLVWEAVDGSFRWLDDGETQVADLPEATEFYLGTDDAVFRVANEWGILDLASRTTVDLELPIVGFVGRTGDRVLLKSDREGLFSCTPQGDCTILDPSPTESFIAVPDGRVAYLAGESGERLVVTDGVTTERLLDSNGAADLEWREGPDGPLLITSGSGTTLVSLDGSWVRELGRLEHLDFLDGCVVVGREEEAHVISLGLPGACGDLPSGESLLDYEPSAPIRSLAVHPEATDEFLVVEYDGSVAALKRVRLTGRSQNLASGNSLHIGRPAEVTGF